MSKKFPFISNDIKFTSKTKPNGILNKSTNRYVLVRRINVCKKQVFSNLCAQERANLMGTENKKGFSHGNE